jgi:hypothetical protein
MSVKVKHRTGAGAALNPDHVGMHRGIVAGVVVTLLAAVLTSWHGLALVAEWQGLPEPMRWVTPVMVDVPLVVLTAARGALAKRGIRTRGMLAGIVALTLFSSTANLVHSLDGADLTAVAVWGGAITNALAPWLILSMTEVLWMVVTRPTERRRREVEA